MAAKKSTTAAEAAPEEQAPLNVDERLAEARAIVKSNVRWAAGMGLIPIPAVDLITITGVQVKMLRQLSQLYGIKFLEHKVKNILASLLTGLGGVNLGLLAMGGLAKLAPGIGTTFGFVTVPAAAGALTHATGQVFIGHFESGGNFLDFKPEESRKHFREEFDGEQERLKNKPAATKA